LKRRKINIIQQPWVGSSYKTTSLDNKKLLVLGESHYCGDCDNCKNYTVKCDFTTWVIRNYLSYKNGENKFARSMNTFTKFTNVFFGKHCNKEIINNFWNAIVFYNYVLKSTKGPRESPTYEMFKNSEPAFFEIIKEYNPDVIIIWGKRLWENLPKNGYWGNNHILNENGRKFYYYYLNPYKNSPFNIV